MDHYSILMVNKGATQEEIQKAYHTLALKYHPDANPGDKEASERIKAVNKAYQILRDPQKRKEYDLTLSSGKSAAAPRSPGGASRPTAPNSRPADFQGAPLTGILENLFQSARAASPEDTDRSQPQASGSTPMVEIKLSTREALAGTVKTILINGKPLRVKITVIR